MNVKNFNPFERHVEKIALAVAAAGAAYMIYMAYPPTLTIDQNGQHIAADEVEQQVTDAVAQLDAARKHTADLKRIDVKVPNLEAKYARLNQEQPLADTLVKAPIPRFGPLQVGVDNIPIGPVDGEHISVATPKAPAPTDTQAVSWRGVVVQVPPQAPNAPPPQGPVQGQTKDVDLVLVTGSIDLNKMLQEMANTPQQNRLPAAFQRAVIYRIDAEKRKREAGGWGPWQPARNLAAAPMDVQWDKLRDEDLQPTLNNVEQSVKQIAQPDYFPTPAGASVVAQILASLQAHGPSGGPAAPGAAPGPAGPRPLTPRAAGRAPDFSDPNALPSDFPPGPDFGGAPAGTPGGITPGAPVQFWAIDDDVQSGQEYQYRVRAEVYNPTYRWPHQMQDPAMKNQPVLLSDWTVIAQPVTVQSSMYFFITDGRVATPANPAQRVTAQLFRWRAGQWYMTDVNVAMGTPIMANGMRVSPIVPPAPVTPGTPATPPAPPVFEDVDTGYVLVDVVQNSGNSDVTAVLMNNKGDLETRDAREERQKQKRMDLIKKVQEARPPIAPTTRPAPRPSPTPRPGPLDNPDFPGGR
jgi:hypothetical protein